MQSLRRGGIDGHKRTMRWPEILVVSYTAGGLLYRLTSGTTGNPWWLLGFSVIAGGMCVLANRRMAESGAPPSAGWLLALPLSMLMGRQLFLLFLGSVFVAYGIFGFVTGTIEFQGRTGPRRTYSGGAALFWSLMSILFGVAASTWSLLQER